MAYFPFFFVVWKSRKPIRVGKIYNLTTMEYAHYRSEHCILLDNLKNEVIKKTLAYMVDFKEHDNLVVIPKPYSIEISNADICIVVIVFSGFEKEEYETLKTKNNYHVVSFNMIFQTMFQSENIPIKYIDYMALFFMSLGRTNDTSIKDFLHLKNPSANETICRLRKEYLLKDIVWNQDLFSLLYKKRKTRANTIKIKNRFATTMVLESHPGGFNELNLRSINSSLMQEFVRNRNLLSRKEVPSEIGESKPLFVGFAVVSGRNRAEKAIRQALPVLLIYKQLIENTKTILLLISSDSIEVNIAEIGAINDYIQEIMGYNANIIMTVSEDKSLEKSLSVTLMLSEFEAIEK
ncbi:MAG: hypothetical protein PHW29_01230 [Flavobacterium sp.]|nr:hypothetical protein [Flavobacterium sp.]